MGHKYGSDSINPFFASWPVHLYHLEEFISIFMVSGLSFFFLFCIQFSVNIADPDQALRFATPELGLHCLYMSPYMFQVS